ncbi:class E sortase [Kribbella sp. CA-293567]|uniref:class E sortase n=1 Tax=Kribbella sp. CA-293567 TaxID=3002436 RepID=UPI0022DDFF58|nr:class E sortase [Kribbella sp. CA-293567]WBQ03867.1 class E sortase [Kribbella sp. CA-293567]
MKTWKPAYRWLAASIGFAALVTVGVVVFGPDGEQASSAGTANTPSAPAATPTAGEAPATEESPKNEPDALVNRMLDQIRNGKPVESQFAPGEGNPASGVPIEAIKAKPGEQLQLGRLAIPKLGVDQQLNNGVDEAALVKGVGHWPGTPLPGVAGNSVISGHRSTNGKPFLYLDRLRPGDPIKVTVGAKSTTYKVVKTTIVPEATYVKFVLRQPIDPGGKVLTLFACNPITAHFQRIVVEARAV